MMISTGHSLYAYLQEIVDDEKSLRCPVYAKIHRISANCAFAKEVGEIKRYCKLSGLLEKYLVSNCLIPINFCCYSYVLW